MQLGAQRSDFRTPNMSSLALPSYCIMIIIIVSGVAVCD